MRLKSTVSGCSDWWLASERECLFDSINFGFNYWMVSRVLNACFWNFWFLFISNEMLMMRKPWCQSERHECKNMNEVECNNVFNIYKSLIECNGANQILGRSFWKNPRSWRTEHWTTTKCMQYVVYTLICVQFFFCFLDLLTLNNACLHPNQQSNRQWWLEVTQAKMKKKSTICQMKHSYPTMGYKIHNMLLLLFWCATDSLRVEWWQIRMRIKSTATKITMYHRALSSEAYQLHSKLI
jgi:hypothetical protein